MDTSRNGTPQTAVAADEWSGRQRHVWVLGELRAELVVTEVALQALTIQRRLLREAIGGLEAYLALDETTASSVGAPPTTP